jgi:hypothetical protein
LNTAEDVQLDGAQLRMVATQEIATQGVTLSFLFLLYIQLAKCPKESEPIYLTDRQTAGIHFGSHLQSLYRFCLSYCSKTIILAACPCEITCLAA